MLAAQCLGQLATVWIVTVAGNDAELSLSLLDGADGLMKTPGQAVVSQRLLQDHL